MKTNRRIRNAIKNRSHSTIVKAHFKVATYIDSIKWIQKMREHETMALSKDPARGEHRARKMMLANMAASETMLNASLTNLINQPHLRNSGIQRFVVKLQSKYEYPTFPVDYDVLAHFEEILASINFVDRNE